MRVSLQNTEQGRTDLCKEEEKKRKEEHTHRQWQKENRRKNTEAKSVKSTKADQVLLI